MRQLLDGLIDTAAENGALDDPRIADMLGDLHIRCETLRLMAYKGLSTIEKYGQPGPEILKNIVAERVLALPRAR